MGDLTGRLGDSAQIFSKCASEALACAANDFMILECTIVFDEIIGLHPVLPIGRWCC